MSFILTNWYQSRWRISGYITCVQIVVNKLNQNREMLLEARVVEKILRSLTNNFENVVCAIEESKDLAKFTVDELAVLLRHMSNVRRSRRKHLIKHFKPRHQSKMKSYSTLKFFKVVVVAVDVAQMVEVVKVAVMKDTIRRRDNRAKKIGMEEDVVEEEAADQSNPTINATNVKNIVTMRMIVTPTNVTIVAEWGILQEIVEPIKR